MVLSIAVVHALEKVTCSTFFCNTYTPVGRIVKAATGLILLTLLWDLVQEEEVIGRLMNRRGETVALFLMDSEGFFAAELTWDDCAIIFALTNLLSSVQYSLSNKFIPAISFCNIGFTRLFKAYWIDDEEHLYGFQRDTVYYEKMSNSEKARKQRRDMCTAVESCFKTIACTLLHHPKIKVAKAKYPCAIEPRKEFLQQVKVLVEILFAPEHVTIKKNGNDEITCVELLELPRQYVLLFSKSGISTPESLYKRAERGGAEVIEKEFANSHEKAQRIALERFRSATELYKFKQPGDLKQGLEKMGKVVEILRKYQGSHLFEMGKLNCLIGLKWHLAEQLAVLNRNLLKISLSKSLLKTLLQFIKERSIGEISPEAVKTKHDCVKENCIKLMKDEIKEITFGLSDVLLKRTKSFFEGCIPQTAANAELTLDHNSDATGPAEEKFFWEQPKSAVVITT
ncbi:unnamed protein product [Enterobius vermicularis]|uniref:GBP domain-containing protein n=1 Tax=Enterobius vermicularis TaxID=51028 RepID=A0A0N4VKC0_ENTVE|nr:unnamed protein product [Enterobius vermicularis]